MVEDQALLQEEPTIKVITEEKGKKEIDMLQKKVTKIYPTGDKKGTTFILK